MQSYAISMRINAPLVEVLGAPFRAEEIDRALWLEGIKQRLGLVTPQDRADGPPVT